MDDVDGVGGVDMDEEWVPLSHAARIAAVSHASVARWAQRGEVRVQETKLGRLYRAEDVRRRAERARRRLAG